MSKNVTCTVVFFKFSSLRILILHLKFIILSGLETPEVNGTKIILVIDLI